MASLMTAIVTRTARPAGAALEALSRASAATAAFRTTTTAVGASATAIRTAATIIAATIASTAAERTLETLAGIAADTRGITRKFFARGGSATRAARRTGFAGEQNDVVFGDGCDGRRGNQRLNRYFAGVCAFRFFLSVSAFGMSPGRVFVVVFLEAKSGMVLGAFMSCIGFGFGAIRGAAFFDLRGFVLRKLRDFGGMRFFRITLGFAIGFVFLFLYFNFFHFLNFFLFEDRAACVSVGVRNFLHFILLGLHDAGCQGSDLIFI